MATSVAPASRTPWRIEPVRRRDDPGPRITRVLGAARVARAAHARTAAPAGPRATAACAAALLVLEIAGSLLMWAPLPLAWLWIGQQVGAATGSLSAAVSVAFLGFVAALVALMSALGAVDRTWVRLRRRAGHEQREGALTQIVVVSATLGLLLFGVWYFLLSDAAYLIPFMPTR